MVNLLLLSALAVVAALALADARAMLNLHRRCLRLETTGVPNPGLLRWYADGFERPLRLVGWLLRAGLVLIVLAVVFGAHPLLIAAASVAVLLIRYERSYACRCRRHHLLALCPRQRVAGCAEH